MGNLFPSSLLPNTHPLVPHLTKGNGHLTLFPLRQTDKQAHTERDLLPDLHGQLVGSLGRVRRGTLQHSSVVGHGEWWRWWLGDGFPRLLRFATHLPSSLRPSTTGGLGRPRGGTCPRPLRVLFSQMATCS